MVHMMSELLKREIETQFRFSKCYEEGTEVLTLEAHENKTKFVQSENFGQQYDSSAACIWPRIVRRERKAQKRIVNLS